MGQKQSYSLSESNAHGVTDEVAYTYNATNEPIPVHLKPVPSTRAEARPKQADDGKISFPSTAHSPIAPSVQASLLTQLNLEAELSECPLVMEKENLSEESTATLSNEPTIVEHALVRQSELSESALESQSFPKASPVESSCTESVGSECCVDCVPEVQTAATPSKVESSSCIEHLLFKDPEFDAASCL